MQKKSIKRLLDGNLFFYIFAKRNYKQFCHTEQNEVSPLFGKRFFTFVQNDKSNTIKHHAHIHLVPVQSEKDMLFTNPKLKLTPEEFKEIADKINNEIA